MKTRAAGSEGDEVGVTCELVCEARGQRDPHSGVRLRRSEQVLGVDLRERLGDQDPPAQVDRAASDGSGLAESRAELPQQPHEEVIRGTHLAGDLLQVLRLQVRGLQPLDSRESCPVGCVASDATIHHCSLEDLT